MSTHCGKVYPAPFTGGREVRVCMAQPHTGLCSAVKQPGRPEEPRFHWRGEWAYCEEFEAEVTIDGTDYLLRGLGSVPRRPHVDNADSTIHEVLTLGEDEWQLLSEDKWPHYRKLRDAFNEAAQDAFDRMKP